jgi:hypothetical protein
MGKSLQEVTFLKRDPKDRRKGIYRFKSCGHEQAIRSDQLKTKWGAKCRACEVHLFRSEADAAGLLLLGSVQHGVTMGRREYQCLACKKAIGISLKDVRKRNFKCPNCLGNEWDAQAAEHGLKRLGLQEESSRFKKGYDLYKFKKCGHEQLLQRTHVKDKSAECKDCKTELLEAEAACNGLQYLGDVEQHGYGLYKFDSCQHKHQFRYDKVRLNKFHCKTCINQRLAKEASLVGLRLLGKAENGDNKYRSYKQSCGHKRDFTKASVKKGTFQCEICANSALTRPSQIYLLRLEFEEFECLKLGYSNNLKRRVASYGISRECSVYLLASLEFETGRDAQAREKQFHGSSPWKWRKLAKKKMREFLVESGSTECYPTEYQAEIVEALGLKVKSKSIDMSAK